MPSVPNPAVPTLPKTSTVDEINLAIDEFGAVVVNDLVEGHLVDRLRTDLAPWIARTPPGSRSDDPEWQAFHGTRTVRFNGVAAKTSTFVEVCLHPTILGVADLRLIPDGGSTQLSGTQVISIGPGEAAQYLHRDQMLWPWFNRYLPDGPEVAVLAMVALTNVTEANGATRIVLRSHLRADSPDLFDPANSVPAEMSAGSVLLFSGKTVHGGGANTTSDTWRTCLHIGYMLGWLRSEEAHPFVLSPELAAGLPRRAQELLGFAEYNPAPHEGGRLWLIDFEDPALVFDQHASAPSPGE